MKILSGMQPSGPLHLGNYLGALRQWVEAQNADAFYCVVDLHALTLQIEPETLRANTTDLLATYLAAGLDPEVCTDLHPECRCPTTPSSTGCSSASPPTASSRAWWPSRRSPSDRRAIASVCSPTRS